MLDSIQSRWMTLDSWGGCPLYSLSQPVEEGMMLCGGVFENGQQAASVVAAPTAAANPFMGVAFSYYTAPNTLVAVETYTVPAAPGPYTVAINSAALNPTTGISVKDNANGTLYTYNATAGAGNFQVSGNVLTFNAAQAGRSITVTYAYAPTVSQVQQAVGDGYIGSVKPSDVTGTIGLIRRGIIFTSNFNPGVDYSQPGLTLYVGPNGIIDPTYTTGPVIPGYVYGLPNADFATLGINFSAV